jgi:hypothetical protein
MSDQLTAWLQMHDILDAADDDLTAQEINRMSMSDFAKLRAKAGLPAPPSFHSTVYPDTGTARTTSPTQIEVPTPAEVAPVIDVNAMSMQEYAQARGQLIRTSDNNNGLFGDTGISSVTINRNGR